ncbi:O-antigen ligase family protein [Paenibacillus sp. PR3]|uniref:O-antigen ligase family protein n=1 Tax=Paenibacillus terricola TaxID=2763503 RepID=A0ABR8N327_9BACL|nr:O-antigen ligase family protein [Paenibacillus terricola]MBD3922558.1 O-antigen ligase family protein [Paenibacillus terricola]
MQEPKQKWIQRENRHNDYGFDSLLDRKGPFMKGMAAGTVAAAAGAAIVQAGLYEDGAASLFSLAAVVSAACASFLHTWRSNKRGLSLSDRVWCKGSNNRLAEIMLLCLFGLSISSLGQLLLQGQLPYSAASAQMSIRWLGAAGVVLLLFQRRWRSAPQSFASDHGDTLSASVTLSGLFITMGVLIGPVSVLGWFGELPSQLLRGFLLMDSDIRIASIGTRLSGFLQYPNAQGAFAAALLLLLLAIGTTRMTHRLMLFAGACLPSPLLLALLLSESRGAALACAAGAAAGCLLLRGRRLALWLASAGWASVCGALACRIALAPAPASGALRAAALLGCFAAGAMGLAALRSRLLAPGAARQGRALAASAALLAGGLAALAALPPQQLYARLGAHYETAASRASLYQEALRLWREAPLMGRGGDTWRHLAGQRFGINEVHSGYLDIALNGGLLDLSLLLLLFGALLTAVWRAGEYRILLAPMLVMLLHAAIDFDMSYGCWWLLLFAIAAYGVDAHERANSTYELLSLEHVPDRFT